MTETPLATQAAAAGLAGVLHGYLGRFAEAARDYDGSTRHAAALEELLAGYAQLVTDPANEPGYAQMAATDQGTALVAALRTESARCVAVIEKYRALRLLEGRSGAEGYFANIESCIAGEFGAVAPDSSSKVLLVGSGSFPMTLLNLASRTGASAVGIDIDPEALELGRRVVAQLGQGLDIGLQGDQIHQLDFLPQATHIVFSSTVAVKYELLHQLHARTRQDVVVAMRFGDGLKSLFNYPMQPVDPRRWQLDGTIRQPGQVFDIALYTKARTRTESN
ncbi:MULTISPECIES: class I SAM-dependent methyltransferase [Micrococcaceae]|uniref:class I SAM-dependent methyltransferase n=2 Tax=Micrococcales TaxID=85006 RepID=UPI000CFE009E|nr:class I SAM-dependent methyltransferase [Arthrobacter sp. MYb222]PQZ86269.1 SAM-dependent methyltransferase [Arthrobacter sp. MYb222]